MPAGGYTLGSAGHRGGGGSTLDDPNLLSGLVKSAKSAHSTLGRALDTNLSHQRFGGAEMEPSALTMNKRERERQVHLQRAMQATCRDTHLRATGPRSGDSTAVAATEAKKSATAAASAPSSATPKTAAAQRASSAGASQLFIPALPTMAPSMTAAADDGTEALGGTRIGGDDRGYVTLIGAVPTYNTTRLIEDNYELVSSFRAYRTDALRTEQETALRDVSAPHPDLLQQLAPLVQASAQPPLQANAAAGVYQHLLVDQETLPYSLRQRFAAAQAAQDAAAAAADAEGGDRAEGAASPAAATAAATQVPKSAAERRTYSFTCQGRPGITGAPYCGPVGGADVKRASPAARRRQVGRRQPCLGQYHLRYSVVEPRVIGGYVQPQATSPRQASLASQQQQQQQAAGADGDATTDYDGTMRPQSVAGENASVFGQTQRDDLFGATNARPADSGESGERGGSNKHGRNIKGSSMFISESLREVKHGTAAPDVVYWPYPDVRSTTKRVPCLVQLDNPTTHRRREPLVSGVPASVYEVCGDIAANQPRNVVMDRTTGRASHWIGRAATDVPGEPLDVDESLRATRPKERVTTLPPRTAADGASGGAAAASFDLARARAAVDTSVSVERDLAFPRSFIGNAEQVARVRDFGKVRSRADREAVARRNQGSGAGNGVLPGAAEEALEWTEARSRSALIHLRAPGHQELHVHNTTELGNVPSLALTKPRAGCTTDLGKGQPRPVHLLPLRDLTYDAAPGYALTGPRVKGTPAIGRTVSRAQVRARVPDEGCGAKVMYNPTDYLRPPVKSVPNFETQITKEYEFRGHRVQSERYLRLFPSAPGPGHYTVNYSQVE